MRKKTDDHKLINEEIKERLNNIYVNVLKDKKAFCFDDEDILFNYKIDNFQFKNIDFSINGINKYLSNIYLKNRLIKHSNVNNTNNKNKYFFSEQIRVLNEITNSNFRCILQASTSFGKTTLVKEILFTNNFNKILFIVPTINLKNEITTDLHNIFVDKNYHIISRVDVEKAPECEKLIIISTQENLLNLKWMENYNFDIVILDEAYNINKGDKRKSDYTRKLVLNKVIKRYFDDDNQKMILLSPSIGDFNDKTKYYLDNNKIKIIHSSFILVGKKFIRCDSKEKMYEKIISNLYEEKNIVYIKWLKEQREFINNILETKNVNLISSNNEEIKDYLLKIFPDNWYWIKAFEKNILINNGKMPNFLKKFTISLFCENDDYHTLIGNSSLFYGINTPTKNIFVYDILKSSNKKINIIDVNNLIGRAGRYGVFNYGNIYINNNDINEQDIKKYENEYKFDIDFIENKDEYEVKPNNNNNNDIKNEILNEIILKTPYKKSTILKVIETINELMESDKDLKFSELQKFGIFFNKNPNNKILWSNKDSFWFCFHLYNKNLINHRASLKNYYNEVINQFIDSQIEYYEKNKWTKEIDRYKEFKRNENEKIDFLIDFLYSYLQYKFLIGLELLKNILSIMIKKEIGDLEKLRKNNNKISSILEFFRYSFYGVKEHIDNKQKYISIYQDLLELGYYYNDIEKQIDDIYSKINNNYSNNDLIKFMSDIKNPFVKKNKK